MANDEIERLIDEIQRVRTRNNRNWMDILRLAFRNSPAEAAEILNEIFKEDSEISDLAAQLVQTARRLPSSD